MAQTHSSFDPARGRQRAAVMLQVLSVPSAAAVIAALPARPGQGIPLDELLVAAGDARRAAAEVSRLEDAGVLRVVATDDGQLVTLDRGRVAEVIDGLVDDLAGERLVDQHPELRPFVTAGRVTHWPTQPAKIEAFHRALADLFVPGELLDETLVNERLGQVIEDVAQARRGLVDRGLLLRDPGTTSYRVPNAQAEG